MKYREAKRLLSRAGWEQVRKGATSHAIWQRGRDLMVLSEHDPVCKSAIVMVRAAIADYYLKNRWGRARLAP